MAQRLSPSRFCGFYFGLALALIWALVAGPVQAKGPRPKRHDEYKRQVERLEDAWRTAQLSGDVTTVNQLLSDDYVGITMSGQVVTKTQQLDRMKKRVMALSKYEVSDVKVKLIGTTAVVTSLAQIDGTYEEQPIHGTFRSTRVYTRIPGGSWKITNFEATRVGAGRRQENNADPQPDQKP
ncbi:MAG TPA: nuclear transport factor 2 family protein [Acidobacteriaceae bacterium]|nr:nuclear transport factor 2 family protein [Acidobacteriaceae bacterium]